MHSQLIQKVLEKCIYAQSRAARFGPAPYLNPQEKLLMCSTSSMV